MPNKDRTIYGAKFGGAVETLNNLPDEPTNAELAAALKALIPAFQHAQSFAQGFNQHLSAPHPQK